MLIRDDTMSIETKTPLSRVMLEERRHRLTLEALADVDAGRLIADQMIKDWADTLTTESPLPRRDRRPLPADPTPNCR